jgi:toxin ParE1/3/4
LKIIQTNAARTDLIEIWLYGAENWGIECADEYLDELGSFIKSLCNFPDKYRLQKNYVPPVRIGLNRSHLVIYTNEIDTISIIRVLHKTMDVPGQLD